MVKELVRDWFALLDYCKDRVNFDEGKFKIMHDALANKYKRLDYVQQGEYTHEIVTTTPCLPTVQDQTTS